MIRFEFEGIWYEVDAEVYEAGRIVLPDGRLFEIDSWTETDPQIPLELIEIPINYILDVVEIANRFDAVLAEAVDRD